MATDRCMLTRPFHMAAADVDFSVDIGGGPVAKSWTIGDYGCIAMAAYEFERLLKTVDAGFNVAITTAGKYNVTRPAGNFQITAMDTRQRKILGFETTNGIFVGGAQSYTADYTPLYTWFPETISRTDRNRWEHVPKIAAAKMKTGALSATETGDLEYQIELEFEMEPRYNIYRSAGRTEAEKDRSLDTFIWGHGTVVTTGVADAWPADSGYEPLDGFYFWPDFSAITELSTMDGGDAESFELTTSPEVYAWCQFDPEYLERVARRRHSLEVRRDYYGDRLPIHTVSDIPTWVTLP